MSFSGPAIWLMIFLLLYATGTLFWARQAAVLNKEQGGFFADNGSMAPWMTALVMAGASISGWIVLGFSQSIASQGFGFGVLALAGIILPLAGVLFFKSQWMIGKRYGFSSQGAIFTGYYGGRGLSIVSAGIAVLFAIGFTGMQLRAIGSLLAELTGGVLSAPTFIWGIALFMFAYIIIGGLRSISYIGTLQTILIGLSIIGLTILALNSGGGFVALNSSLAEIAQTDFGQTANLFQVAGVVQFTAGLGVEDPIGSQWSAVMIFSTAMALMGFQASPMATQLVLNTRNARGFAAGQTWIMAGIFGLLIAFGVVMVGAYGIATGSANIVADLVGGLAVSSPWFAAAIGVGLVAAVQIVSGLSIFTGAQALVLDIYVPFFHKGQSKKQSLLFVRVCVGLLLFIAVLLATLAPVSLSAIGAVALPAAFQLWPALIGLCWFGWISRQAATTGAIIGIIAVFVTDNIGANMLGFLGLDLPWGRWPWTIHSAAWGMFFNLLAVIVISAITQGRGHSKTAHEMRGFLGDNASIRTKTRGLKPAAWSVVLAWLFLALGPGVVLGNAAFGAPGAGFDAWRVGMPSLWAWVLLFWVLGVFLIWFLAYRLEMATAPNNEISCIEPTPQMPIDNPRMQEKEFARLVWSIASIVGVIALITWVFG